MRSVSCTDLGQPRGPLPALVLGLCLGATVACGRTETPTVDSGTPVDTDTSPSLAGTAVLPEDTERDVPLTAGLVRVEFGEGPLLHETLSAAPVEASGDFLLSWAGDAGTAVASTPGNDHPDALAAFYLLLVFEDADESGTWEEGERIAGGALDRWLVWLEGEVPEGWPRGWSVVDLGLAGQYKPNRCLSDSTLILTAREEDGYPVFYDLDSAVAVRLRGLEADLTLAGSMSGLEAEHDRFLSLPYQALTAETIADYDPVFDVAAAEGAFSVALTEAPPEAHVYTSDASWRYSVHVNLLFEDVDGDGAWDHEADDLTPATTCAGGLWTYARYTWPVSDYRGLRFLDCYEGQVGWRTALTDPDSGSTVYMSSAESAALEVDPASCSL